MVLSGVDASMMSGRLRAILFLFLAFIALYPAFADAQIEADVKTDAVFLLDVTASMVGNEVNSQDIMKSVIERLIWDINRFQRGRIVIIPFASGPHDLDGSGPIGPIIRKTVRNEEDKQYLKSFLRPSTETDSEFGAFPDAPNWPGVYLAVKDQNPGGTRLYKTVMKALDILRKRQNSDESEAYANSHVQKLYVYSDGNDNQPFGGPSFENVVNRLKNRYSQMQGRFDYRRYLFLQKPEQIDNAKEECRIIEDQEAATFAHNIAAESTEKLATIGLDRQAFSFPNLWSHSISDSARSITLEDLQIRYQNADPDELAGKRLKIRPITAQDLGLPQGVAVHVRTAPQKLQLPLEEFDLTLRFTPATKLDQDLRAIAPTRLRDTIELALEGSNSPASRAKDACILSGTKRLVFELNPTRVPVHIPYALPELSIESAKSEDDQVRLDVTSNQLFKELPQDERTINLQVLPAQAIQSVVNSSGAPLDLANPFELPSRPFTAFVNVDDRVPCGKTRDLEVRLSTPRPDVLINGEAGTYFSEQYLLQQLHAPPNSIATKNLWTPKRWAGSSKPAETSVTFDLCGAVPGKIRLVSEGVPVPARIEVEPSTLQIGSSAQEYQLGLTITPEDDWKTLGEAIGQPGPDLKLTPIYSTDRDNVLTVIPSSLPINLEYILKELVSVRIKKLTEKRRVPSDTDVYRIDVSSEGIPSDRPLLKIEDDAYSSDGQTWQLVQTGTSQVEPVDPGAKMGAGSYVLRLYPELEASERKGTLRFQTLQDTPLLVQPDERKRSGNTSLEYHIQVIVPSISFNCEQIEERGRWTRGAILHRCRPETDELPESQLKATQMTIQCSSRLALRVEDQRRNCGEKLDLAAFRVSLAPSASAGAFTVGKDALDVSARIGEESQPLEVKLKIASLQGYLYPHSYDQQWEKVLSNAAFLVWPIGLGLFIIVILGLSVELVAALPFVIFKLNPIEAFMIYVVEDERGRYIALAALAIAVVITIAHWGVGFLMNLQYGP